MRGSRGNRKQTLRAWRERRAGGADFVAEVRGAAVPGAVRVRPRHRAPTPSFVPSPSHVGSWFARPLRIGLLVLVVAAVGGAILVWRSDHFVVSGAYVNGNARVPAQSIFAASGLGGRSVFAVRRYKAETRIEALPDVRDARVRVTLPNQVSITVVETEPRLLWTTAAGRMAIDENGYAVFPPADGSGLVQVADETGVIASTGQRLPEQLLEAALAYGQHFGQLAYRKDVGFSALSDAGVEIRLGTDPQLVDRQLATLAALGERLADRERPVAYVDVRFAEHPFIRAHGGAE
ncbi:MAG: cell division protein FtsQ/DivIB [Anaerolineae bacterium]